jgi:AP-2 complex subunit alpha
MFANFDALTMNSKSQPRGLHNFISDIRNSAGKDEERKRIDDELAKVRGKFTNSSNLTSYDKKKYILKMCYIYLLGYEVDFGHVEFIALLSSTKFSEKAVGYLAIALMLRPGDQLFTLLINSVSNDLTNRSKIHYFIKALALNAIANINGPELSQSLSGEVQPLIIPPVAGKIGRLSDLKDTDFADIQADFRHREALCKKASLALLAFYRLNPDSVEPSEWVDRFISILKDMNISVVQAAMSLILGLATTNAALFEPLVPHVILMLQFLVIQRQAEPGYLYYKIPSPWLQVKCLRFLQLYKLPEGNANGTEYESTDSLGVLYTCLQRIFSATENTENLNKSNAEHAVLFEAINLIMCYGEDVKASLRDQSLAALGRFINIKDANIRYLGLDALIRLAQLRGSGSVQTYQEVVLESLKDLDISVRKRALELIFAMTDRNNAEYVVGELVTNLAIAETAMKEDFVVKIAILAEKYPTTWNWYVDTLLKAILVAGDFVAEAVWHRIVQVVINHPEIHAYAAEKMFATASNKFAHEIAIGLAGYLLGEIGENICTLPGKSGYDQFAALHHHYGRVSSKTQAILLTSYVKLVNLYPDTQDIISDVFRKYATSNQLEIQQRSCEYLALPRVNGDRSIMENVLNTMPAFPEDKSINSLYALLNKDKDKDSSKAADGEDDVKPSNSGSVRAPLPTPSSPRKTKEVRLL